MRLQILIDNVEPGGAQNLLPGFAIAAQRAGVEVLVGYLHDLGGPVVPLAEAGVEPVWIPVSSLLARADRARVRNHLAESRPDVLHTHLGGSDFLGGIAAKALGIPAISTLHQVSWQTGSPRDKVKYRLQALARRRCAANVIAVCEAVRERYLSRRWDKPSRVVTVHNGIADQSEPGAGRKVRDELGLAPTDLVMTMVSVLRRDKAGMLPPDSVLTVAGHDVAVPAMRALAGEFPDVRLVVVGDGPDRAVVEGAMSSLGHRAMLVGHRDDVPNVLDATDILIHPAYLEAFPTVLLEAMASRVPVVATAVGGIPEMVGDQETGVLIDAPPRPEALAEGLRPLLSDRGLRVRFGEAGRRRFERQFTTDRWVERVVPLYESAIEAAGATS